MKKVIISTGGTGGHIYPALSVARELKKKEVDILFIGSKYRMEKEIVPDAGYKFIGLDIKPFNNFKSIYRLIKSFFKSLMLVLREKPDAIIGFGNYTMVPVILVALLLRKKVYLQEQNCKYGSANNLFYKFVNKTFLAFDKTYEESPIKYQNKLEVLGNPLRDKFYYLDREEERKKLKLQENEKMLLITGGSLGAKSINEAVLKHWQKLYKTPGIRIYWATGKQHFEEINNQINQLKANDIIKPYFENMAEIMCAADLVLCRAGALTISELIQLEKPSILIPYNYVGQNSNAKILEEREATVIFSNEHVKEAIDASILILNNTEKLNLMKSRLKTLKKGKSAEKIVEALDIWRNN